MILPASPTDARETLVPCLFGDIRLFMSVDAYEVRQRKNHCGVDLISDVLPFGRRWYGEPNAINNASHYAKHRCRSHDASVSI